MPKRGLIRDQMASQFENYPSIQGWKTENLSKTFIMETEIKNTRTYTHPISIQNKTDWLEAIWCIQHKERKMK